MHPRLNTFTLRPVLCSYSTHCIKNSFTFAEKIKSSSLKPSAVLLCSFDIANLFTNVPLAEIIKICADALYNTNGPPFLFSARYSLNLWKWQHALMKLASTMSFINKPTALPWDHLSARPLPKFLLARRGQNPSINFMNPLCTIATWMTFLLCLTMNENVFFSWNS